MEPQQTPLQPEQSSQPALQSHVRNPLSVMQPGEQIICEVKRHPIGMLGVYGGGGGILLILAILAFVVAPNVINTSNRTQVMAGAGLAFIIVAAFVLVFVFIANIVYWGNHWVVTSDSITQITQTSLFSKQSSQLSLGNLEDITVEQNGILAQLFKFGVLKAETAGERSKFVFLFCPKPNYYAQKILAAREVFEQIHHGGKQVPYVAPVTTTANPNPLSPPPPVSPPESNLEQPAPAPMLEPDNQYQIGQTPPDFSVPSSQPPADPDPTYPASPMPPADGYAADPDPGVNINTNTNQG